MALSARFDAADGSLVLRLPPRGLLVGAAGGLVVLVRSLRLRRLAAAKSDDADDPGEFVHYGGEILRWIATYRATTAQTMPVQPRVAPNYLRDALPSEAPVFFREMVTRRLRRIRVRDRGAAPCKDPVASRRVTGGGRSCRARRRSTARRG